MRTYKIGIVVGSLQANSLNRKLAHALTKLAPSHFEFTDLPIGDLPLYNQDHDANPAAEVRAFKKRVADVDGLLFATPEYNRSIPGVLKNALDHASRPYGESVWGGKPGAIVGVSPGAAGTAMAQQHLRNILAFLDVPLLSQPEVYLQATQTLFDDHGNVGPASHDFLQGWMNQFTAWVEKHAN